ncbi:hypothetical protein [Dysgonomonas sp. 520]|uniref:hypothetical protein n=1 Tax=Dysgonomonas sp. 520 TaxID=2302931 RepID=UPI0013D08F05|nr:hypothetical protein [Dysgonomonas sp. 520]NDW09473.1 hypothetical protein [Dysgonomonas sp. 520]
MKKLLLLITLCLLSNEVLFSQSDDNEKESAFHFSIFPPLSTNGDKAKEYTNDVSFSLLAGESRNEKAFAFAGLANIIKNDANGLQLAGLYNGIGNNGKGIMFAGLVNTVGKDYNGLQFAGLFNAVNNFKGLQFGGLMNMSDNFKGLQAGGLINAANNVNGIQFSGLLNAANNVNGVQAAGLINTANDVSAQFSGLLNLADNVRGFQIAGLMNVADNVKGVQIAGLANKANDVKGSQIAGIFNKAKRVTGTQVGILVNIADESDYPVGLVNLIKNGEKGIAVTYNEIGSTMATFRSGGRVLYGIVGLGYNHKAKHDSFAFEGGFGAHINLFPWMKINNEIKFTSFNAFSDADDYTYQTGYSLLPAFRLSPHFEIFGGPSINYMQSKDMDDKKMFPSHSLWKKHGDSKLQQLYIGYQVGVQYIF